jgi:hypothetical protein
LVLVVLGLVITGAVLLHPVTKVRNLESEDVADRMKGNPVGTDVCGGDL